MNCMTKSIVSATLVLAALGLTAAAAAGQRDARAAASEWGVYAELAGTVWNAPGGYPRRSWVWSADGSQILEVEQRSADSKPRVTTLKLGEKRDRIVAQGGDAPARHGEVQPDGSVEWAADLVNGRETVDIVGGALVIDEGKGGKKKQKKDGAGTRFARSSDTSWVVDALDGKGGKGKGKKGKGGFTPSFKPMPAPPASRSAPRPSPRPAPAPAAPGGDSLDCMMQSAEVRARGCKPPAANPAPASGSASGGASAGGNTVVNGQRVTRAFPANILGRYLYEKKGEPIIELRGDGTGSFQAHMIAPIAIRWWLKAGPDGGPEKITGYQGNYRYTVVLQYQNSSNGNYPSGGYDSWYLDTDLASGCSIILGERFKCR